MIVRAALRNTGNYVLVTRGCSLPRLNSLNSMHGVGLVAAVSPVFASATRKVFTMDLVTN